MTNFFYRLFLAFNSTFLIVVVFLVKEDYYLEIMENVSIYWSWLAFMLVPVILTLFSFLIARGLSKDILKSSSVDEIELANNNFLPTYLGYFFVSLGVNNTPTLIVVFLIIYIFTFLSQTLYFNPIFLLFGYHFYFVKTTSKIKLFLITKKKLKTPGHDSFENLRRINDYTFIEIKEK